MLPNQPSSKLSLEECKTYLQDRGIEDKRIKEIRDAVHLICSLILEQHISNPSNKTSSVEFDIAKIKGDAK